MNLSLFIGTIYIEKSSNLAKILAEMKKPTLEFLRWTLEFLRWNSNVQHRNSNMGFPTPTSEFQGQGTDHYLVEKNWDFKFFCSFTAQTYFRNFPSSLLRSIWCINLIRTSLLLSRNLAISRILKSAFLLYQLVTTLNLTVEMQNECHFVK